MSLEPCLALYVHRLISHTTLSDGLLPHFYRWDSDGSDVKAEVRFKHRTLGSSETQLLHVCDLGPVTSTSWQIDGETVPVAGFTFGTSKITADGDCSHETKRRLLLGRKVMTNLDSIFKSRNITLPTMICLVKGMIFLVVMYGCESWTMKKAKCWRIDAFELWCWRRLLRVPWSARRFNQSILKEISPEYSLEELMLKLKLQSFGHLMRELTHLERPWC